MKNKVFIFLLCALVLILLGLLIYTSSFIPEDVNRDGKVTAQDYVLVKKYIMEGD